MKSTEEILAERDQKIMEVLASGGKHLARLEIANPKKRAFRREYDRRPARIRNMDKNAAMFGLVIGAAMLRTELEILLSTPLPRYALGKYDSGFIDTPNEPTERGKKFVEIINSKTSIIFHEQIRNEVRGQAPSFKIPSRHTGESPGRTENG